MESIEAAPGGAPKSGFVSALAWTFIVFAACGTVITLLQNIVITVMFPLEEMQAGMRELEQEHPMPGFFRFMIENVRLVFASAFVACLVTLAASIGLLLRKNWARVLFIALLLAGVVANLAGAAAPFFMVSSLDGLAGGVAADMRRDMGLMVDIASGVMALIAVGFAVLFAWTAKRLMADDVRREFI